MDRLSKRITVIAALMLIALFSLATVSLRSGSASALRQPEANPGYQKGAALCPPVTTINGILGSGSPDYPATSGLQTGRILNGLGNFTCGSSNPCSLNTATGSRAFDAYTFTNTGSATECVTVSFTIAACALNGSFQFSARLGSFDPANPCTNYLGDAGAGFAGPNNGSFSFNVPAGQNFVVVVNENDPASSVGCAYTLAISGLTCQVSCPPATITGTIGKGSTDYPSTSGVQTGRVSQNGVDSTCATPKTCPGIASAGVSFAFDSYQFGNDSSSAVCVTFTFPTACGVNNAFHPVAYLGSFDPANPCTNYLGDIGHSINASESGAFSVNVPANSTVVLVLHETGTQPGCQGYSFSVTGLPCQASCPPTTAINGTVGSGSPDFPATSGQQTGRLLNGLGNNTCGSSNPCSLNTPTGSRAFDAYTFNNPGATACVTVNFTFQGCASGAMLQFSARIGSFDPANPCANYVGDGGAGFAGGSHSFSFNVPAGQDFVVVVNENDPAGATGCAYTLTISGITCGGGQACTLTCPSNITQPNDTNQCGAVVNFPTPTTSGDCGAVTCTPASGSFFPKGTTTVTCTEGNSSANCSFTVTINDTQPPTITCPANITQSTAPNQCSAVVTYPPPTVTDNCAGVTTVCSPASGSTFPKGTTTVTCSTTGAPTQTCTFTITVQDTQPPTITCPANITTSNAPNQCGAVVTYPPPVVSDNCPDVGAPVCSPASGAFFPVGATTVTCTVADASPNSPDSTCTFTITVQDTQPPSITCPANITAPNAPNQCGAVVSYPAPVVSDNCSNVGAPVCSPASGSFFPVGTTTVTCTVADASPNSPDSTCTFTIRVNDTQPPQITCPANVTAVTDQNVCPSPACTAVTYPNPVASDNCPGVTVVCNPPSGSCFPVGVTTVTCTATDASGNTATCSFTVTVFDTALQDDSNLSTILLWNSITGQYRFCCNGTTFTGVGKATLQGCVYTLQHNPADRRVLGRVDKAVHAGSGSIQAPAGALRCTITDRNTLNDPLTPPCQ